MIKSSIDPSCTGLFSNLFLDYIKKSKKLERFYHEFPTIENFGKVIKNKTFKQSNREVLVKTLESQYEGLEGEEIKNNINSLLSEKTFTVTTGHQLNLMTGPLYFIYKIVTTILLAEKLKEAYPDYHFVPVYWMASEDHDFDEINHFYFDGKNHQWHTDQKGPVGEFFLDNELKELIYEWDFLPDFFKNAYNDSVQLKEAVRKYVHHLFSAKGLVILDGNDTALKKLFLPIIKDDVLTQKAKELVNRSNRELEALGYKTQVFPREINYFYMDKGLRERIVHRGDHYNVLNTAFTWTEKEIVAEMEMHPEKFSPNVVMRPLYQETILPNLAYLGGPAEVAYWFQLYKVFDHYNLSFPFLLPRNFALILPVAIKRKCHQLDLEMEDIFKPLPLLRKEYVLENAEVDVSLTEEKEKLAAIFKILEDKAIQHEITLKESTRAAYRRSEKILDHMADKFRKADEKKKHIAIRQLFEVKERLFPKGIPQERVENFLTYYLEDPVFIDSLFLHFDPLDFNFNILEKD
ncbi:MAG: bacillithiol biosynthesis cysteine-adding enzyme BshC [Cyclobacteriaceae bacterium]